MGKIKAEVKKVQYLFDSKGKHIANFVNGQLYAPTGQNIGHYMKKQEIFIDMSGRYLGEIVMRDRLMFKLSSPYRSMSFGSYGNYGNIGNYGNPGNHGSVGIIGGYRDIEL